MPFLDQTLGCCLHSAVYCCCVGVFCQGTSVCVARIAGSLAAEGSEFRAFTAFLPYNPGCTVAACHARLAERHFLCAQLSPECQHLIHHMFRPNPEERCTIEDIMRHPWFVKDLPPQLAHINSYLLHAKVRTGCAALRPARCPCCCLNFADSDRSLQCTQWSRLSAIFWFADVLPSILLL